MVRQRNTFLTQTVDLIVGKTAVKNKKDSIQVTVCLFCDAHDTDIPRWPDSTDENTRTNY